MQVFEGEFGRITRIIALVDGGKRIHIIAAARDIRRYRLFLSKYYNPHHP